MEYSEASTSDDSRFTESMPADWSTQSMRAGYARWPHRPRLVVTNVRNIASIDGRPTENQTADVAVLPGEEASTAAISRAKARVAIVELIQRFAAFGFSTSPDHVLTVSHGSAKTATAFLHCLPVDLPLPKIAPDGDGGTLFVWDGEPTPVLVALDEWRMYVVRAPNTAQSEHFEASFDGESVPRSVLDALRDRQ